MEKLAIVYWSGTGNTKKMAEAIQVGTEKAGTKADLFEVDSFDISSCKEYQGFLFGCPAMGDEVLEEAGFEPFFSSVEEKLSGVPVALFGSYGWGDGAWMRNWQERVKKDGMKLYQEGLIVNGEPTADDISRCEAFGKDFAASVLNG